MAGRHNGNGAGAAALSLGNQPPFYPGSKLDRAYSEGRGAGVGGFNPHPAGSPEYAVWNVGRANAGLSSEQLQTCWGQQFQPYPITDGTEIDVSPSTANWTAFNTPDIFTNVTSNTIGGTGIRMHKASGSAGGYRDFSPVIIPDSAEDTLAVWFWCDFAPTFGSQEIDISVYNPGLTNGARIYTNTRDGFRVGWNCIRLPRWGRVGTIPGARPSIAGNASMNCWSNIGTGFDYTLGIARIYVLVKDTTSFSGTYSLVFGGLSLGYRQTKPSIMIGFDDGYSTPYTVTADIGDGRGAISTMQRMIELGIPGYVGVYRDTIGDPGYLTAAQLQELYNAGWEITTHGQDPITSTGIGGVFPTAADAVNDGYPDGPFTYGDGMRYNQKWITDNGLTGSQGIYLYPLGNNRASGIDWQRDIWSLSSPYFDTWVSNAPGPQVYDFLPTLGDQDAGWQTFGRVEVEAKTLFPNYASFRANFLQETVIREKVNSCLVLHRVEAGGTQSTLPVADITWYADDLAYVLNYLADQRDAGNCYLERIRDFKGRMIATGAPAVDS